MQQKNTGKIIAAFLLVTAFAVVSVFSVLQFVKEPTTEEIEEYKAENNISGKSTVSGLVTEEQDLGWLTEEKTTEKTTEEKTTEKKTTEEKTTEEKTTEEKTTEKKTTEEKTTEEKTTEKKKSEKLALEDVTGTYSGKGTFTNIGFNFSGEMFEGMSESELQAAKAMVEGLKGTSFDISFSIDETGEWEFDMDDEVFNLDFDSYDFQSPVKELENNGFSMVFSDKNEDVDGEASFDGVFSGSGDDISVEGRFAIDMVYEGTDVEIVVDYSAELGSDEGV